MARIGVVSAVIAGASLSAIGLAATSASAQMHIAVPSCPSISVVAKELKVTVSKLAMTSASSSTGSSSRTCIYSTSAGAVDGQDVEPTTIRYGAPVTTASFAEQKSASAKGAVLVNVTGLGSEAFAVKAGNGLFVLDGSLEIVVSAPKAPEAEMVALGHVIL